MEWYREFSKGFISTRTVDLLMSPSVFIPTLLILIIFFLLLAVHRLNKSKKDKILINEEFAFSRSLHIGLNPYQADIIKKMSGILLPSDSANLLDNSILFEKNIQKYIRLIDEKKESFEEIYKNIIIMHEKIYQNHGILNAIDLLSDVEPNRLVYMHTESGHFSLGKITSKSEGLLHIRILSQRGNIRLLAGNYVNCYIWRYGDGAYTFTGIVDRIDNLTMWINIPSAFERSEEAFHPFVSVDIECHVEVSDPENENKIDVLEGIIFQLNENEMMVRIDAAIGYGDAHDYTFFISEFIVKAKGKIIRHKPFKDRNVFYYNVKFIEISPVAKTVIKNYIAEISKPQ